jgi:putative colanic acid biosynthesis glycosyltransferase
MKVLQINLFAGIGSTGKIAADIGEVISNNGHLSYIAALESTEKLEFSKFIRIENSEFVRKVHFHIFSTMLDLPGWGSLVPTLKLIFKIIKVKPDIIHLHHIYYAILNINVLFVFLKLYRIPLVWTFHDCWAFTGGCSHFISYDCNKWKSKCGSCERFVRKGKFHNLIDNSKFNYYHKRLLFKSVDNVHIVTVSKWLKETVEQSFFLKNNITVISNAIDTDIFYPIINFDRIIEKYKLSYGFNIIAVSGHWNFKKGYEDFLLLSKSINDNYKLILVGLSDEQIKTLPTGIIGIKHISDQRELAALYSFSNVVISLSREETFGLTIIEGLSCGIPAIVYDNTALPEIITPDVGFVVKTGAINDVCKSIYEIDKNGRDYYKSACREKALSKYSKREIYLKYLDLYSSITRK